ncbi:histidine phosphatase superfamily [Aspergillus cavernicola]|uniref:Histidine phosphatase superfamily n=1 Tax=Aspergillus cavernicola TaxID=176166 RepID=A0ABR4J1C6_9EURO
MLVPIAATLLGGLTTASAETILGVTIFSRHGDRTSKHYPSYTLTNLGAQQNHRVGSDYRSLYLSSNSPKQILGISEDVYVPGQIFAQSPDQDVLSSSATAFLQGLYPPLTTLNESESEQSLSNGTTLSAPLNGYQYVQLRIESPDSPDSIWIKGDDSCNVVDNLLQGTQEAKINATRPFYQKFASVLENVTDIDRDYLSYEHAYDIYDLINTARIHNASMEDAVSDADLFQLRTLADSREFSVNFDPTYPEWSIGGRTLAGAVLNRMKETIATNGTSGKFSLMTGSYDTMLQFFSVYGVTENNTNTDFTGLPEYASTIVFELFTEKNTTSFPTDENDLKVRFLFHNGSTPDTELTAYPLFGADYYPAKEGVYNAPNPNPDSTLTSPNNTLTSMPYIDFKFQLSQTALTTVESWCRVCDSHKDFCVRFFASCPLVYAERGMSNAVAGVIGAMVALAVVGGSGALAFFVVRRLLARRQAVTMEAAMAMGDVKGVEFDVRSVKSGRVRV